MRRGGQRPACAWRPERKARDIMVAKVTFTVKDGELTGREFVFDKPANLVVGRAEDCSLRLAGGIDAMLISRHHCRVDVDPPIVRVRDLGSLNGTYVNGKMIGQR